MKMFRFNKIVILVLLWICGAHGKGFLPSALQRCHFMDEKCYTIQAQNYFQHYKYGIPEHNVPGIEPLDIGTLRAQIGGENSPMQINLVLTNTSIHHFGNSTVKSLKFDSSPTDPSQTITTTMLTSSPYLVITADFSLKGKFLILPIDSKGKVSIKLNQVDSSLHSKFVGEKRADGLTYLKVVGGNMSVKIGSGHFDMTDIFDDPEISKSTLKVFNDEWKAFEKELEPKISAAATRATQKILQKLSDLIPTDDANL